MLPFLGRSDACLVDEESLLVIVTGDASVVEVAQSGDRQLRAEGGSRITVEKIETFDTSGMVLCPTSVPLNCYG